MKKIFQSKLFKNVLAPVFRGTIKTVFPPAATLFEIGKNISAEKKEGEKNPHNWTSIATQVIMWGLIIYAFASKTITVQQAIDLIKSIITV